MSALFQARVVKIDNDAVQVRLYIIHPDQTKFYASQSFALQLLWDATQSPEAKNGSTSPLAREIKAEEILDAEYVIKHQDEFIEAVEYIERKNYPRSVNFDEMNDEEFNKYWENEEGLPQALLLIKVTNPRWIAHLSEGLEWETSAYNM